jgi:puromycin-sensitive aminopeptidase
MQWWTHLWLNEGFARFLEHIAVDHFFKEWDMWTQYVSSVHELALNLDSLESSRIKFI